MPTVQKILSEPFREWKGHAPASELDIADDFYTEEFPGLFFFGSNGGLESIAFDMHGRVPWPIVMVDCIAGMDSLVVISESFSDFTNAIGIESTDDVEPNGA